MGMCSRQSPDHLHVCFGSFSSDRRGRDTQGMSASPRKRTLGVKYSPELPPNDRRGSPLHCGVISRRSSMPWLGPLQPCKRTYASDLSNVGAAGEIFPDWLAARLLAAGMKTSWLQTALARSSRGPPISHWDGFLASLRLGPHACDCCTLESALGLTECERSVKWL